MECSACLEIFEPINKHKCLLNHEELCITCWASQLLNF